MIALSAGEPEMTLSALREQAKRSAQQGDWTDALRIWKEVQTRFPDNPAGYIGAGIALRETGRLDEAESLLTWANFPPKSKPVSRAP